MTWNDGGFDGLAFELERGRFGEYTAEKLMKRFGPLKPAGIKKLKSFPTLFVGENLNGDARVGYLTEIRERNRHVLVEFEFDKLIAPFPAEKLKPLLLRLDMGGSELYRTHWAIKEEDLLKVLSSAGLIGSGPEDAPTPIAEAHFKVALSFPGESRDYVGQVAEELKRHLPKGSVFYDRDFTAQLAQPNLDTLLQGVYGKQSDLVVVFLSANYDKKEWCGLEWRAIREFIKRRNDHTVMLMRFDDAEVPGVMSLDGYVDLRHHESVEAAKFIVERVRFAEQRSAVETSFPTEVFRMREGDQTTYINVARFSLMMAERGTSIDNMPPTNRRLLDVTRIGETVFTLDQVMKTMNIKAIPIRSLKTVQDCDATVGKLISFKGRFRSAHAPRVKNGGIPEYHPTGDIDRDHIIRKSFGNVELILPLDSFWYASNSSVGFYRSMGLTSVHGLARVHSVDGTRLVASPLWMTLPHEALFD
jgi:hypothetical protein